MTSSRICTNHTRPHGHRKLVQRMARDLLQNFNSFFSMKCANQLLLNGFTVSQPNADAFENNYHKFETQIFRNKLASMLDTSLNTHFSSSPSIKQVNHCLLLFSNWSYRVSTLAKTLQTTRTRPVTSIMLHVHVLPITL